MTTVSGTLLSPGTGLHPWEAGLLLGGAQQGQERLLGADRPVPLLEVLAGASVSQDHLGVAPPQGGLCSRPPNKCSPKVWCGSTGVSP